MCLRPRFVGTTTNLQIVYQSPKNACQIFLSKKTPEYSIFPAPSLKIRVSPAPSLAWVFITVCVPETRSIGLKKTNSAGLFKAGLRHPRVSAKCEFTEFRNESLEIISV